MKREEQKILKSLNKEMSNVINRYSKCYKLKKKDNFVWTSKGNFFFCISFYLRVDEKKDILICSSQERCKPLWADELLWEIMEMKECLSASMSLRGNGAFAFYGLPYNSTNVKVDSWQIEEIEKEVCRMLLGFQEYCNSFRDDFFYGNINKMKRHNSLFELLHLIYLKEYKKAYSYASEMKEICFISKGKNLSEYAKDYCTLKMNATIK